MRPPNPTFLLDRCIVYAPPVEAFDSEGGSSLLDGAPGPSLPCFVDLSAGNGQPGSRLGEAEPYGLARHTIRFATDPGVDEADQRISVTVQHGVTLETPIEFRTLARCLDHPIGIEQIWNVAANLKV